MSLTRVVLLIDYNGLGFSGSQAQDNAYTVQEALETALTQLNVPHNRLSMAGRTDAGVHARGQVTHFDTTPTGLRQVPDLVAALNARLPQTLSVQQMAVTEDPAFHATCSARWRWYRYRIYPHPTRSAWLPPDALWVKYPLDTDAMQRAADYFLGTHDFESFKCPRGATTQHRCHVIHSRWSPEGAYWVYDIVANRFLYKMVRNLVGLMLQMGLKSQYTPEDIPAILAAQNRQAAGPTAQPYGLSLMAVDYPAPWDFFSDPIYGTSLKQMLQESCSHEKNLLGKAS